MRLSNSENRSNIRAVTPVVSVILVVAITVILAASVSVFVLSFNIQERSPATALELSVEEGPDNIIIQHRGGESLQAEDIYIELEAKNGGTQTLSGETVFDNTGRLQAGEREAISPNVKGSTHVTVIHKPSGSILTERTFRSIDPDDEALIS